LQQSDARSQLPPVEEHAPHFSDERQVRPLQQLLAPDPHVAPEAPHVPHFPDRQVRPLQHVLVDVQLAPVMLQATGYWQYIWPTPLHVVASPEKMSQPLCALQIGKQLRAFEGSSSHTFATPAEESPQSLSVAHVFVHHPPGEQVPDAHVSPAVHGSPMAPRGGGLEASASTATTSPAESTTAPSALPASWASTPVSSCRVASRAEASCPASTRAASRWGGTTNDETSMPASAPPVGAGDELHATGDERATTLAVATKRKSFMRTSAAHSTSHS
jgi:hypothetical protein